MTQITVLDAPEAFFRANLYHFLPDYPASQYAALYNRVRANQLRAAADYQEDRPEWVAAMCLELSDWLARVRACPGIIATYHTGSYRLLSLCLATAGLPLALLVSADVAAREGLSMAQRQQALAGETGRDADRPFVLLEAEDPQVLRRICRLLARGYQVVVYVDGNMGVAGGRSTDHLLSIPFLAGSLRVRQGIPVMAYLGRVPVYPVRCDWQQGMPRLVPAAPMAPGMGEPRRDFAIRIMTGLYAFLQKAVERDPATWECWQYLHPWIAGQTGRQQQSRDLDALVSGAMRPDEGAAEQTQGMRWQVFRYRDRLYLIDAKEYVFYPM